MYIYIGLTRRAVEVARAEERSDAAAMQRTRVVAELQAAHEREVCIRIYVFIYIYIYIYVYIYIYMYMYMFTYIHVCIYTYISTYIYVSTIFTYLCVHVIASPFPVYLLPCIL